MNMPALVPLLKPLGYVAGGVAIVAGQVMAAAHRPDIPGLANQDPSGSFGDPKRPATTFVLLGDSSVTAPGVDPLDATWPRRMAHSLAHEHHIELVNVAVGGAKARDVLLDQVPRALAVGGDIALVSVGANDALRGTTLGRFEREMHAIVRKLLTRFESVGVAGLGDLGSVPRLPTLGRSVGRVRGRAFDRALVRVAAGYPDVVKSMAWGGPWRRFNDGDPRHLFSDDWFHASANGHALFAGGALAVAHELLARRYPADPRPMPTDDSAVWRGESAAS